MFWVDLPVTDTVRGPISCVQAVQEGTGVAILESSSDGAKCESHFFFSLGWYKHNAEPHPGILTLPRTITALFFQLTVTFLFIVYVFFPLSSPF